MVRDSIRNGQSKKCIEMVKLVMYILCNVFVYSVFVYSVFVSDGPSSRSSHGLKALDSHITRSEFFAESSEVQKTFLLRQVF